jgi:hypothetical protein
MKATPPWASATILCCAVLLFFAAFKIFRSPTDTLADFPQLISVLLLSERVLCRSRTTGLLCYRCTQAAASFAEAQAPRCLGPSARGAAFVESVATDTARMRGPDRALGCCALGVAPWVPAADSELWSALSFSRVQAHKDVSIAFLNAYAVRPKAAAATATPASTLEM